MVVLIEHQTTINPNMPLRFSVMLMNCTSVIPAPPIKRFMAMI